MEITADSRDAGRRVLLTTSLIHLTNDACFSILYPILPLIAADLGLSLHRSSSGVDLPMKIADMFGAHLPVCALDYGPVLNEVLHDGDNGVLFRNSAELATRIVDLCAATADAPPPRLERLRDGAARAAVVRWQDEWGGAAWPVIGAS